MKEILMEKAEAPKGDHRGRKGLVIVYTGEGKGKTTAALGLVFRAWGRGMKVCVFQFIKNTTSNAGEHRAARKIGIEMKPLGDGFTWLSKDIEKTKALAVEQWGRCKEVIRAGEHDILVLDEFTYALRYGWVPVKDVIEALCERPEHVSVIVTGRYAPQELIDDADLVTEMKEIKHPYQKGIKAQPGIDF